MTFCTAEKNVVLDFFYDADVGRDKLIRYLNAWMDKEEAIIVGERCRLGKLLPFQAGYHESKAR